MQFNFVLHQFTNFYNCMFFPFHQLLNPLHSAARYGKYRKVISLLKKSDDINKKNERGVSMWKANSNHWNHGLDFWSKLLDRVTGFDLFNFHPIKCAELDDINCLFISWTSKSPFLWMLVNVHECTMHKLHRWMCIVNLWCTCIELTVPSGTLPTYCKHVKATRSILTKNYCAIENCCQVPYWLGLTRLIPMVLSNVTM